MSTTKLAMWIGGFLAATSAAGASAGVLAFDEIDFVVHQAELQTVGSDIFTKGYRLAYAPAPGEPYPVGFAVVGPKWRFNGKSIAIAADTCSATTTLTSQTNNPFSVRSIDLTALNGDPSFTVRFVGVTTEGQQVDWTVEVNEPARWRRYEFPSSFVRLASLSWLQADCESNMPHMFDNIFVQP